MISTKITTVDKLYEYLHHAMMLEHATIPPYLLALYSIHPNTNLDAVQCLRVVVVEEMLHLTLAANVMNAVGGKPNLSAQGFVPLYPAYLPDGEQDFQVNLEPFSPEAISTFLHIERPGKAPTEEHRLTARRMIAAPERSVLAGVPGDPSMHYYSIGEFYAEIERGLKYLHGEMKDKLFSGARERQVGPEYFYSGGGKLNVVTDLPSALVALEQIVEQGEGLGDKTKRIYDHEGELAHYYRFDELNKGRRYQKGDKAEAPMGPQFQVKWDAVYPFKKNARLTDYPEGSDLRTAAVAFNKSYADFLALLTTAYNGKPELLLKAVPEMFVLRGRILQLIHNPMPGTEGVNAAPTFEIT
jgi:hypothetical protein